MIFFLINFKNFLALNKYYVSLEDMGRDFDRKINEFIGKSIRKQRKSAKISIDTLASAIGKSKSSIVQIENGDQSTPIHNLYKIAETIKADLFDLIPNMDTYAKLKSKPFDTLTHNSLTESEMENILLTIQNKQKRNPK